MSTTKPLPTFLIGYSNSDFTNPHEVVLPDAPKDCRNDFTHMGAKYSGLESRRHKATGLLHQEHAFAYNHDAHNWLVIGLRERAEISSIHVSTQWFTGNQVQEISVYLTDELTKKKQQVLDRKPLNPDALHTFEIVPTLATECLIECYYEGGISRVHFFGVATKEQLPARRNLLEEAIISHISNEHYGKPAQAVTGNRKEMHMLGWESARTGFGEKALFWLKEPATIDEIIVDTYLHRLNAPLSCHVFGLNKPDAKKIEEHMKIAPRWKLVFGDGKEIIPEDFQAYMLGKKYLEEKVTNNREFKIKLHLADENIWKAILPFAPLLPDTFHKFNTLEKSGPVTHILYMHYPNGGIHGLKIYGNNS